MSTLTEGFHAGEFIGEMALGPGYHNDAVTVASGEDLAAGAVVGAVPSGTATATAAAGNTGTGALTVDATTPVLPGVEEGTYTATCITAATNGGTFRVTAPSGAVLGDVAVGSTFANQIKFAIADGATDFAVGDSFDVTVSALSEKVKEYDPAATDGAQVVRGILYDAVDASAADADGVVVSRGPLQVNANDLSWKTGMTDAEKATAKRALLALGIRAL